MKIDIITTAFILLLNSLLAFSFNTIRFQVKDRGLRIPNGRKEVIMAIKGKYLLFSLYRCVFNTIVRTQGPSDIPQEIGGVVSLRYLHRAYYIERSTIYCFSQHFLPS